MGVPVAYIFFDIAVNAAFGYFFLKYYYQIDDLGLKGRGDDDWLGQRLHGRHRSGYSSDGGDDSDDEGCYYLRLWALVTGSMLIFFAIFHLLAVINYMTHYKLSRIPLLGDLLGIIECNWTDIYLICMLIIWTWAIVLALIYPSIFECERKLILLVRNFHSLYISSVLLINFFEIFHRKI